jgi:hypothetical protein
VLARAVLVVEGGIIERRRWKLLRVSRELLSVFILLQQREHHRDHLPRNPPEHLAAANAPLGALVIWTLEGKQFLLQLFPFALIHLNRFPHHQVQGTLHHA